MPKPDLEKILADALNDGDYGCEARLEEMLLVLQWIAVQQRALENTLRRYAGREITEARNQALERAERELDTEDREALRQ